MPYFFLPKKPCKFGVKVWVLAEAKTGYVLNFQVYTGAVSSSEKSPFGGLAYRVVMEPYQGKGHRLFMDNFYTSLDLVRDLLKKGTFSTGTWCRNRRDFPDELKKTNSNLLESGSFRFATSNDLTAVLWKETGAMSMF